MVAVRRVGVIVLGWVVMVIRGGGGMVVVMAVGNVEVDVAVVWYGDEWT
jgi:hypothetical protein